MKHFSQFITNASKYPFETPGDPPRRWLMRQPLPDEAADGDSAYRITYSRLLNDRRLKDLAGGGPDTPTGRTRARAELEQEARIRASAAEAIYMLPLLLEDPMTGEPAFDVADPESMAEFEALGPAVVIEMTRIYWDVIKLAESEAKKKPQADSSSVSGSAKASTNGPSSKASSGRPGRKS